MNQDNAPVREKFSYGTSAYSKCKLDDEQKQMHLLDWIRINREIEKLHKAIEGSVKTHPIEGGKNE